MMNRRALLTSISLSVLFLVVYSTTNHLAAQRAGVPSFYFQWERHIPFLPIFIIPYMSIDLFFVASPFLCRNREQMNALSRRIIFAIVVAGFFFLFFPLRFAFDRPHSDGWTGAFFDWFRGMDQPFNQFPSLHIALRTILATLYVHRTRGLSRWLVRIWFSLIGFSTLFTYQHHIIDIVGGFVLGVFAIYLFTETPFPRNSQPNPRVGVYYASGAMLLGAISIVFRPWAAIALWPASSMFILSLGYLGLGASIYCKRDGQVDRFARLVLAPVMLGQFISWLYYKSRCRKHDALSDHLWLGRLLDESEARQAVGAGVTAVLDLTGEFSEPPAFRSLSYLCIPILDLTAPSEQAIEQAIAFIAAQSQTGIVYIHCKVGYSRTAAVIGSYLLQTHRATDADDAIAQLRAARQGIIIRPEAERCIRSFKFSNRTMSVNVES